MKNELYKKAYELYLQGHSLAQVARIFGLSRQSIYIGFKRRRYQLRTKKKLPTVMFNGYTYSVRDTGYYGKTSGKRTLLHRDIWEFHYGPIPKDYDIHHKDWNKLNNDISNLMCISKSDHARIYKHGKNQYNKHKK